MEVAPQNELRSKALSVTKNAAPKPKRAPEILLPRTSEKDAKTMRPKNAPALQKIIK